MITLQVAVALMDGVHVAIQAQHEEAVAVGALVAVELHALVVVVAFEKLEVQSTSSS